MKITTQQQADAVKKHIDARKEYFETEQELKAHNLIGCGETLSSYEAALAAWNERKELDGIVLSEDELTVLECAVLSECFMGHLFSSLQKKGMLDDTSYGQGKRDVTFPIATAKGRAYLEAQKPRKIKWEVWCKDWKWIKLGSFDCKMEAEIFFDARVHRLAKTVYCEVREVKP